MHEIIMTKKGYISECFIGWVALHREKVLDEEIKDWAAEKSKYPPTSLGKMMWLYHWQVAGVPIRPALRSGS